MFDLLVNLECSRLNGVNEVRYLDLMEEERYLDEVDEVVELDVEVLDEVA